MTPPLNLMTLVIRDCHLPNRVFLFSFKPSKPLNWDYNDSTHTFYCVYKLKKKEISYV